MSKQQTYLKLMHLDAIYLVSHITMDTSPHYTKYSQ